MRRVLLVVVVVCLAGVAGCLGDDLDDQPGVDLITDGAPDSADDDPGPNPGGERPAADDGATTGAGELAVHHLDVGQADATLLVTPANETILIDSGDWRQDGSVVIEALERQGIERIDHLIATHGHADHIGGHAAVIEWAETEGDGVGAAYDSGIAHTSATYENYLDAVDRHAVELFVVQEGDELPLSDPAVEALFVNPPTGDADDGIHTNSVSLVVEFGNFGYVTTGDAEANTEARIVDRWAERLDVDVVQAGHHGSNTSNSVAWLDATDPELAVISSDRDSRYGHPHDEILQAFADRDIETYWTGVHGDIVVTTDGDDVRVATTHEFSTDAADLLVEKSRVARANASPRPLISLGAQSVGV